MILACDLHGEFILFEDLDWDEFQEKKASWVRNIAFALEVPVLFRGVGGLISKHMNVRKNMLPFKLKTSRYKDLEKLHTMSEEMKKEIGQFNIERHSGH